MMFDLLLVYDLSLYYPSGHALPGQGSELGMIDDYLFPL